MPPRKSPGRKAPRPKVPRKLLIAAVIGSACIDEQFRRKLFAARDPVAWVAQRARKRAWTLTEEESEVLRQLFHAKRKKRLKLACEKVQASVRSGTRTVRMMRPWCTYPCAF